MSWECEVGNIIVDRIGTEVAMTYSRVDPRRLGTLLMSPAEARELAAKLLRVAQETEDAAPAG